MLNAVTLKSVYGNFYFYFFDIKECVYGNFYSNARIIGERIQEMKRFEVCKNRILREWGMEPERCHPVKPELYMFMHASYLYLDLFIN